MNQGEYKEISEREKETRKFIVNSIYAVISGIAVGNIAVGIAYHLNYSLFSQPGIAELVDICIMVTLYVIAFKLRRKWKIGV